MANHTTGALHRTLAHAHAHAHAQANCIHAVMLPPLLPLHKRAVQPLLK
jgi:hypothetical protein